MRVELLPQDIESLLEALDCLKTKIAFTKGFTSAEKKDKLVQAEALEQKLLDTRSSSERSLGTLTKPSGTGSNCGVFEANCAS
jgi:hypothetical protein